MMKAFLKKLRFPAWSMPLALLVLCVLSFGLLLPSWGLYWDDWAKLLVNRIFGAQGYWPYYAEDRPLSGWTHILLTPLLGEAPLGWQVFTVAMRWLTSVGLWWGFSLVWPRARRAVAMAALLFTVYPVFNMQPIAVTFHQQWMQFALYAFSFALMVLAWRKPRQRLPLTLLSLALTAIQLTVTEYFIGLELLRPLTLFLLVGEERRSLRPRLARTLVLWAPYLALLVGYVVWRLFFIQLSGDDPYQANILFGLLNEPRATLGWLWRAVSFDTLYVWFTSWQPVLDLGYFDQPENTIKLLWGLGLLSLVLTGIYLMFFKSSEPDDAPPLASAGRMAWLVEALVVGLAFTLVGCIPAWSTGRQVIDDIHSNRYALPAMFGPALLFVVFLEWAFQNTLRRVVVFSAMIGALVMYQYTLGVGYQKTWEEEMNFFWQLAWRAPYLEPGTAVLTEQPVFSAQGGFSVAAALNLLYPQESNPQTLAYWYYSLKPRFEETANAVGIPLYTQFRTLVFEGETPNSLLVMADPSVSECLWVLDQRDAADPQLSGLVRRMLPASSVERISATSPDESYPPRHLFNQEPDHEWCYVYQKMELALQMDDNARAEELADQARAMFNNASDVSGYDQPHEWLPIIEAYARAGRWEDAADATLITASIAPKSYGPFLCSEWHYVTEQAAEDPAQTSATRAVHKTLTCPD